MVYHYDANNKLNRINRFQDDLATVNYEYSGSQLFDEYDYDELGHRIRHRNALYNQSYKVLSASFDENGHTGSRTAGQAIYQYDGLGRVTQYTSFNGEVTLGGTITSSWNNDLAGSVNTSAFNRDNIGRSDVASEMTDYFGQRVQKNDLGNQQFFYYYNYAGWLSRQTGNTGNTDNSSNDVWESRRDQDIRFTYHHNGYLYKKLDYGISVPLDGDRSDATNQRMPAVTEYRYDDNGNRTGELYYRGFDVYNQVGRSVYQHSSAVYDERNRVSEITGRDEYGSHYKINYKYDAFNNRRSVVSVCF